MCWIGPAPILPRESSTTTYAVDLGQSHGPQDSQLCGLAHPTRDHASVHSLGWFLAEYDRVDPAYPKTAGIGRTASHQTRGNHRLAGSSRPGLESKAYPFRMGWQASQTPCTEPPATPCVGRIRCLYSSPGAATTNDHNRKMAMFRSSDPLVRLVAES